MKNTTKEHTSNKPKVEIDESITENLIQVEETVSAESFIPEHYLLEFSILDLATYVDLVRYFDEPCYEYLGDEITQEVLYGRPTLLKSNVIINFKAAKGKYKSISDRALISRIDDYIKNIHFGFFNHYKSVFDVSQDLQKNFSFTKVYEMFVYKREDEHKLSQKIMKSYYDFHSSASVLSNNAFLLSDDDIQAYGLFLNDWILVRPEIHNIIVTTRDNVYFASISFKKLRSIEHMCMSKHFKTIDL